MRALPIELLPEPIELALLPSQTAGGRDGGLLLERAVHPLVDAILLWLPRLNELGVDPQLDEPYRQLREPRQGVGCKRYAVIRPDAVGQPVDLKKPFEMGETLLQRYRRVSIAPQQLAA